MIVEIIINPLKGFTFRGKEILFGMSQKEVEIILGKPSKYEVNNLIGSTIEPREGTIFFYKNNGLTSIDIQLQESVKVYYEGIDILHDKESVMKLSKYDTPTANDGKYMNFYELGISLGGYGRKRIDEKKLVSIFSESEKKMFIILYRTGGGRITHSVEDMKE